MKLTINPELKSTPRKDGLHAIRIRITIDRKNCGYINLNKYIEKRHWDAKQKKVKPGGSNSLLLNNLILEKTSEVSKVALDLNRTNKTVTKQLIFATLNGTAKTNIVNLVKYFEMEIENDYASGVFQIAQYNQYHYCLKKLKEYKPVIAMDEITPKWLKEFEHYLTQKKLAHNTRFQYFKFLSKYIKKAINDELVVLNPFKEFKFKMEITDKDILEVEELRYLYNAYTAIKDQGSFLFYWIVSYEKLTIHLQMGLVEEAIAILYDIEFLSRASKLTDKDKACLQNWLFDCFCGLRFSDLSKLRWGQLVNDCIILVQAKSTKPVVIPLTERAKKLLPPKGKKDDYVFPELTSIKYNRKEYSKRINKVVKQLGIDKNMTYHSARRTFGTLSTFQGIGDRYVQELLGLSDSRSVKHYVRVGNKMLVEQMKKFDFID